jgi:RNA polymerase sigma factor (sigma-70 family)
MVGMSNVTQLLAAIQQGQPQAAAELLPLVYDELRRLARQKLLQEKPGHTLQATALVHEAYLRLIGKGAMDSGLGAKGSDSERHPSIPSPEPLAPSQWDGRGHFFAAAAEAMRRILVDSARRKRRLKRGGELERQPLEDDQIVAPELDDDLIELDAALEKLAVKDVRKAELIKLRYFAGLTIEQAAEALGISTTTADRDWTYARAWLFREMSPGEREPFGGEHGASAP